MTMTNVELKVVGELIVRLGELSAEKQGIEGDLFRKQQDVKDLKKDLEDVLAKIDEVNQQLIGKQALGLFDSPAITGVSPQEVATVYGFRYKFNTPEDTIANALNFYAGQGQSEPSEFITISLTDLYSHLNPDLSPESFSMQEIFDSVSKVLTGINQHNLKDLYLALKERAEKLAQADVDAIAVDNGVYEYAFTGKEIGDDLTLCDVILKRFQGKAEAEANTGADTITLTLIEAYELVHGEESANTFSMLELSQFLEDDLAAADQAALKSLYNQAAYKRAASDSGDPIGEPELLPVEPVELDPALEAASQEIADEMSTRYFASLLSNGDGLIVHGGKQRVIVASTLSRIKNHGMSVSMDGTKEVVKGDFERLSQADLQALYEVVAEESEIVEQKQARKKGKASLKLVSV